MTQAQYLDYMRETTGQGPSEECLEQRVEPKKPEQSKKGKKGKSTKKDATRTADQPSGSVDEKDEDRVPEVREEMLERLQSDLDTLAIKKKELEGIDWGQGLWGNMKMIHKS